MNTATGYTRVNLTIWPFLQEPSKRYISGLEFAIHVERRTPLLKSGRLPSHFCSENELSSVFFTNYELITDISQVFQPVIPLFQPRKFSNIPFRGFLQKTPISKDIIEYLKHNTENMSKYISEAVRERIAREKREKALREILAGKPTFTDAKDGTTYVRELRSVDKKRDKRLRLI